MFASRKEVNDLKADNLSLRAEIKNQRELIESLSIRFNNNDLLMKTMCQDIAQGIKEDFSKQLNQCNGEVLSVKSNVSTNEKLSEFRNSANITGIESVRKELLEKISTLSERLENTLTGKIEPLVSGYQSICEKVLNFNRDLFIKDMFFNVKHDSQKQFDEFKAKTLQPLLEAKWEQDKIKQGERILNKGINIINERNRLYGEILVKERQGENVDKLKEQLKSFDWILENIKDEK